MSTNNQHSDLGHSKVDSSYNLDLFDTHNQDLPGFPGRDFAES